MFGGKLEVIIDIQSFRNIDLYEQGLYALRIRLQMDGQENVQPYKILESSLQKQNSNPIIYDDIFFSSIFEVLYSDQYIELDDACIFTILYNAYPNRNAVLKLMVELLYINQFENVNDQLEKLGQMQCVSKFNCFVRNSCDGVKQCIQTIFDDKHFGYSKIYIHTMPLDYKFSGLQHFEDFLKSITNNCNNFIPFLLVDEYQINQFLSLYVDNLYSVALKFKNLLIQAVNQIPQQKRSPYIQQLMQLALISTTKFKNEINEKNLAESTQLIINQIGQVLFSIWNIFQEVYQLKKEFFAELIDGRLIELNKKFSNDFFQSRIVIVDQFNQEIEPNILKQREQTWGRLRDQQKEYPIEDLAYYIPTRMPVFYEDVFQTEKIIQQQFQQNIFDQQQGKPRHVIVLAHGYQGCSLDMQQWRNYLKISFPKHLIVLSTSNEYDTEVDIREMGLNLANEIQRQIKDRLPTKQKIYISFIGHSLGGVLLRVAMQSLPEYKFHTFISLGSPHLGLGTQQNSLVETGLWFMKAFKKKDKRECLDQMTLADSPNLKDCLMSKITQNSKLGEFRNVILTYSLQDQYVPYQSATLTRIPPSSSISERATLHNEMIENILKQYKNTTLIKVGVFFPLMKTNLDTMIGRTAHIEFLENITFIRQFIDHFHDFLQ